MISILLLSLFIISSCLLLTKSLRCHPAIRFLFRLFGQNNHFTRKCELLDGILAFANSRTHTFAHTHPIDTTKQERERNSDRQIFERFDWIGYWLNGFFFFFFLTIQATIQLRDLWKWVFCFLVTRTVLNRTRTSQHATIPHSSESDIRYKDMLIKCASNKNSKRFIWISFLHSSAFPLSVGHWEIYTSTSYQSIKPMWICWFLCVTVIVLNSVFVSIIEKRARANEYIRWLCWITLSNDLSFPFKKLLCNA